MIGKLETRKEQPAHIVNFILAVLGIALFAQRKYGVSAKDLIVRAGLSSNWGRSPLAREHNNYFGTNASRRSRRYLHFRSMDEAFHYEAKRVNRANPRRQRTASDWQEWDSLFESIANRVREEVSFLQRSFNA